MKYTVNRVYWHGQNRVKTVPIYQTNDAGRAQKFFKKIAVDAHARTQAQTNAGTCEGDMRATHELVTTPVWCMECGQLLGLNPVGCSACKAEQSQGRAELNAG